MCRAERGALCVALLTVGSMQAPPALCTPFSAPSPSGTRFALVIDRTFAEVRNRAGSRFVTPSAGLTGAQVDCVQLRLALSQALSAEISNVVITSMSANPTQINLECTDPSACPNNVAAFLRSIQAGNVRIQPCTFLR